MPAHTKVLDSWALIAFLEDEPGADKVEDTIISALNTNTQLLITTVNMGEVWYSLARAHNPQTADNAVHQVTSLGVKMVPVDWDLSHRAARFKARYKIAFADCFAAALSSREDAEIITGDREFTQLEDEIKITWL